MDKDTRNKLRGIVVECRKILENDILGQLEGTFGIHRNGRIESEDSLPHLDDAGREIRQRAVAAVQHIASFGEAMADAVDQFQREVAFTHLNRLCAFKLLERRGFLDETISRGTNSNGFKVYLAEHPEDERRWRTGGEYEAYRHYLFDVCARLTQEIKVLFDTEHISSHLFPARPALQSVLDLINDEGLAEIWESDETLGWIYQYFTPKELRDKARKESAAPRNSYELAFRNQFYTPRYVVQFLTDNTLGRIWYEMRRGETALTHSEYMVRRKRPVFLEPGEEPPSPYELGTPRAGPDSSGEMWIRPDPERDDLEYISEYSTTVNGYDYAKERLGVDCADLANERLHQFHETKKWHGTFEELRCCLFIEYRRHHVGQPPGSENGELLPALYRALCERWDLETDFIAHRAPKLPWHIKILDPASGSGHFLLYCFDLLETIYDEAYDDAQLGSEIQRFYPDRATYRLAVPALIISDNLHGIDIDLRSTQIASLVLWLRAQRSYSALGATGDARPKITRANVVCAEPMPGDEVLLDEFCDALQPSVLGDLVRPVWDKMKLAGEAGSLLKIEEEIRDVVRRGQQAWTKQPKALRIGLFDGAVERPVEQAEFDLSEVTSDEFWERAEGLVVGALEAFAGRATNGQSYGRRLFADDAEQGFAFIDMTRKRFDVVLMNPPFGEPTSASKPAIFAAYPKSKHDLATAFADRGRVLLNDGGRLGSLANRTIFFGGNLKAWREELFVEGASRLPLFVDLGIGVLDGAMVEAVAYTLALTRGSLVPSTVFLKALGGEASLKELRLHELSEAPHQTYIVGADSFVPLPGSPFAYWTPQAWYRAFHRLKPLAHYGVLVKQGMESSDNFRFVRLWWETPLGSDKWKPYSKGGQFGPQWHDLDVVVNWGIDGQEVKAFSGSIHGSWTKQITNSQLYGRAGITYPASRVEFSPRILPRGNIVGCKGPIVCFAKNEDERSLLGLLAILSSSSFRALLNLTTTSGDTMSKSYREQAVAATPVPDPHLVDEESTKLVSAIVAVLRELESAQETSHQFVSPRARGVLEDLARRVRDFRGRLDNAVSKSYGFIGPPYLAAAGGFDDCVEHIEATAGAVISYAVGCVFGRWDIQGALEPVKAPEDYSPFDSVTSSAPGTLEGLQDSLNRAYPIRPDWDGILVEDPGHEDDIVRRVEEAIEVLTADRETSQRIGAERIDTDVLRKQFRNPKSFWEDHVKRYSKSRRHAPIYWLLQSPARVFSLWLYYHRLTKDVYFLALRNYVDPKFRLEETRLRELRARLDGMPEGSERKQVEKQVDEAEERVEDVRTFKERLERVADLGLEPDLDDGVVLNIAPLHELVPWKESKKYWDELTAGKYEWSTIAKQLRARGLVRG